ncbi:uncharacterized protein LOC116266192 [Nymphaea colorata]|uniref:TIR domain-containing protein n=1 Tax=Nymphaea colorata TaxID=210225 RepID=A0A5K0Y6T7_9MAGN|nr:uncharacterized protein LOC116266192 [Nymphaea colorata]VVV73851.1 unnamed protein product [Nymphaea colorata]
MELFAGEEPPPLSMCEPKTVRNLSSSSSSFVSAKQSPFFSPRTPPSFKSSSSVAAEPTPSSISARLFGSGSTGVGSLGGERLASQSRDSSDASLLKRVVEGLRERDETRKEDRSLQVDLPNSVLSLDSAEKCPSESCSLICSDEGSDHRPVRREASALRPLKHRRIRRKRLSGGGGGGGGGGGSSIRTSESSYRGCSTSLSSSAGMRSCDVYIGTHGRKPLLLRFTKWLRSALESEGIACFAADRARYRNSRSHDIAERVINSATFGIVIITKKSFSNPYTIDELKIFLGRKNLIPIYFDLGPDDCITRDIIEKRGELWEKHGGELWVLYDGVEKEWREAVDGLSRVEGSKLDAHLGHWRDSISSTVNLIGLRLGRRSVAEREKTRKDRLEKEEFPFPRNDNFVGRRRELLELELMLFGDVNGDGEGEYFNLKTKNRRKNVTVSRRKRGEEDNDVGEESQREGRRENKKGKEQVVWKESEKEIEMQRCGSPQDQHKPSRNNHGPRYSRSRSYNGVLYGKGVACVSGESGIGKTELLLEYAYRYAQRYKLVLWVGGESRFFRQNYLNLCSLLGLDVGTETQVGPGKYRTRSFEEQEALAFQRVRRELIRDIPYLLVIDNLESEKDWWDAVNIMELLPRFGGATHVLISTRLPRVMNLEPLKLSYLSSSEAMTLVTGEAEYPVTELDALRTIEEKLDRLPLGLRLVGSILSESELPVTATWLLDTINRMPLRDLLFEEKEDSVLRYHPSLMQLLDVCFSIFDHEEGPEKLASSIVWVSGWFAPSAIPVPLLAQAVDKLLGKHSIFRSWKKCFCAITGCCRTSHIQRSVAEAAAMLVRFGIARCSSKQGWIYFHDIIKQYARKRGGSSAAQAMVCSVSVRGTITWHADHLWAACFLLFGIGNDPIIVELKVPELMTFIRRVALPLAVYTFNTFSRCHAAVELLYLCTRALEAAEESLVSKVEKWLEKSFCWGRSVQSETQLNANLWHEMTLLKATLLETRAKLMLKSGMYDIGEDLCRSALSMRTVVCGLNHPDTISLREMLAKLIRFHISTQNS